MPYSDVTAPAGTSVFKTSRELRSTEKQRKNSTRKPRNLKREIVAVIHNNYSKYSGVNIFSFMHF
jgi:hypothetical protein